MILNIILGVLGTGGGYAVSVRPRPGAVGVGLDYQEVSQ